MGALLPEVAANEEVSYVIKEELSPGSIFGYIVDDSNLRHKVSHRDYWRRRRRKHTHTHIHTRARAHTHTCTHTHTHTLIRTHKHTHTHARTCTHTHTHTHTHRRVGAAYPTMFVTLHPPPSPVFCLFVSFVVFFSGLSLSCPDCKVGRVHGQTETAWSFICVEIQETLWNSKAKLFMAFCALSKEK